MDNLKLFFHIQIHWTIHKRMDPYTDEVDLGSLLVDTFTKHDFDPEGYIEVELGQQVSFTINISFS